VPGTNKQAVFGARLDRIKTAATYQISHTGQSIDRLIRRSVYMEYIHNNLVISGKQSGLAFFCELVGTLTLTQCTKTLFQNPTRFPLVTIQLGQISRPFAWIKAENAGPRIEREQKPKMPKMPAPTAGPILVLIL
jgi:hypothetical protein